VIKIRPKFSDTVIFSDLHYGHDAEFIWEKRGFDSPEMHHEYMINQLENELVHHNRTIISLGDIMFRGDQKRCALLRESMERVAKVNTFWCIDGNHDMKFLNREKLQRVNRIGDMAMLQEGNQVVIISHYPLLEWPSKFYGAVHLHGHCHGNLDVISDGRMDCSADELMRVFDRPIVPLPDILDYIKHRDLEVL